MSSVCLKPRRGTPQRTPAHIEALERLFARVNELSSLPHVALQIIQVAEDETSGADDLLRAVESDPSLAVRVLRRVNSSFYALRNQVTHLKSAINLLGFREMRNLALTVYVSRMFQNPGNYRMYSREGLWHHLVAVAATSRMIARECGRSTPDECYLAGLLHDIGFVLIDERMRKAFCQVLDRLEPAVETCELEQEILTFDHTELGAYVGRQWQLPDHVTAAIRYHHEPEHEGNGHRDVVGIVAISNYLCSRKDIPSLGIHNVRSPSEEVFAELGIGERLLARIWDQLEETLSGADVMASI